MVVLKIFEIQPSMRNITVTGRVKKKGDIRQVETRFGLASVSWAVIEDETEEIRLNLWRHQIDQVNVDDTIKISNAFVRLFEGRMELNIGADGRIEKIESGQT